MAHAEDAHYKALEQVDSDASRSVWRMFFQSVKGVLNIEGLHDEILEVWREADYASRINQTFQDTIQAFDQFASWSKEIWDLHSLQNIITGNQIITATLLLMTLATLTTVTRGLTTTRQTKHSNDKHERDGGTTNPVKVLSIFEMAKTAYIGGHTEEVMKLVDKLKFDVNFPIPTTGMSLFLCACISGEKKLVEYLLQRGGDTSAVTTDGDSCLYLATFATRNSTSSSLIELLIEQGCQVNGQNYRGNTALHLAASSGNVRQVQVLLSHGADPVRANNVGISPLNCSNNAGHLDIAEMLDRYTHV